MMRVTAAVLLAAVLSAPPSASAQSTNAEIYLAPIERIGDSIVVGTPVNLTRRAGYDNQPAFTVDSRSILYVAQAGGQTDIWRYDLGTRRRTQVTRTPESEYSPTQVPGERRFSTVRVERDSTQRLWSFAMAGGDPRLVLRDLRPVGYHGWIDNRRLAAYVLGTPSTLHVLNRDGTGDQVVARDVGRALQTLAPGSNALFTFAQRDSAGRHRIHVYSGRTVQRRFGHQRVTLPSVGRGIGTPARETVVDSVVSASEPPYELVAASPDNEFHAWTPDNVLVTTISSQLVRWNATLGRESAWIPVADLTRFGVQNVSRLTFSRDGAWLAFVAEPVGR